VTHPHPPTTPYIVVVNDVGVAKHHGSKMVTARLVDELSARGFLAVTIPAGENWRDHTEFIDRAWAVVLNGEGTLHHSAPGAQQLLTVAPYCQARSIPVFLVNSIWQDNSSMMAQQAKSFTAVFVRESRSQKQLADAGVVSEVVPDLVVGWSASENQRVGRNGVVVTDSVVLSDTQQLAKSAQATGAVFTTLEPVEPEPLDYTDTPFIRLRADVSRSISHLWSGAVRRAYRARGALLATIRRRRGWQVEFSLDDFFTALRHSELLITGRFHAVCMAMVTGTPFLAPSSNSHKIEAMLEDAGLAHRVISSSVVKEAVLMPPTWTDSEAEAVARYVGQATRVQKEMFDTIARHAHAERNSGQ
jgi:polysaccharide pyruvyl transferase WcaK-like protein